MQDEKEVKDKYPRILAIDLERFLSHLPRNPDTKQLAENIINLLVPKNYDDITRHFRSIYAIKSNSDGIPHLIQELRIDLELYEHLWPANFLQRETGENRIRMAINEVEKYAQNAKTFNQNQQHSAP